MTASNIVEGLKYLGNAKTNLEEAQDELDFEPFEKDIQTSIDYVNNIITGIKEMEKKNERKDLHSEFVY